MSTDQFPPPVEQPFVVHLIELRDRLLRVVVVVVVIFLGLFAFANDLYTFMAEPLLRHMPEGTNMIATEVASPFLTPFKLTLVTSIFLCIPFILYQGWAFIAPGLYKNEKKLVMPLLVSSTLLFYLGMAFAYYVVFPLVFGFLTGIVPTGVEMMTDISRYLDFVLKMFFAFGFAFEVPIATILVIWTGLTTPESLASKRAYIIVAAFVIGMLLTPPDIISQTLLALPMWILFELGLVMAKIYKPEQQEERQTATATASAGETSENSRREPVFTQDDISENIDQDDYHELTEAEMDAELDHIEEQEFEDEDEWEHDGPHEEFEPIAEEQTDTESGDSLEPDSDDDINSNTDDGKTQT